MNINELINKKIYVSQKKICECLGIKYKKSGDSRVGQIKEIEENYLLDKKNGKFLVVREKTAQEKQESRIYKNDNMIMETFFYSYLHQCEGHEITVTIPKLIVTTRLVNDNYYTGKYNQEQLYELIMQEDFDIDDSLDAFYSRTENNFRAKIKNMLNSMVDKSLIIYTKHIYFVYIDGNHAKTRRATSQEEAEALRLQQLLLEKYKNEDGTSKTKSQLTQSERYALYMQLSEKIKQKFKCNYYSYEYDIILNKKGIDEHLVSNINILRSMINDRSIKSLSGKYDDTLIDWLINDSTKFKFDPKQVIPMD